MHSRKASEVPKLEPSGRTLPCQEPTVSPWSRTPGAEPPGHRSLCSLSYCFHFELAIPSLFLSEEASPTPTYFRTSVHFQVSFFVCSFVKILISWSLSKLLWGCSETQRYSFWIVFLVLSRRWLRTRCVCVCAHVPVSRGPLNQKVLALAWDCTGACNGTTDWPRADNLQGPGYNSFPFLYCTHFITVTL